MNYLKYQVKNLLDLNDEKDNDENPTQVYPSFTHQSKMLSEVERNV